jgi:hypothetical protein
MKDGWRLAVSAANSRRRDNNQRLKRVNFGLVIG